MRFVNRKNELKILDDEYIKEGSTLDSSRRETQMNYNLDGRITKEIKSIAEKYLVKKIILFGSRARGDNKLTSDIDIAVCTFSKFDRKGIFVSEIQDLNTLLKIDIVFLGDIADKSFVANIEKEGVVIYERLQTKI